MKLSEALARTSINRLTEFSSLSDVLEPDVIQSCLDSNGMDTLRQCKLPMDAMVWAVIERNTAKFKLKGKQSYPRCLKVSKKNTQSPKGCNTVND